MDGSVHDAAYIRFHRSLERRSRDNRERERLADTHCEAQLETTYQHSCMSVNLPFLS
jgi:hypothetical protein